MDCRATCTDCDWTYRSDNHEGVTEKLERHARKEQHHVTFHRIQSASV